MGKQETCILYTEATTKSKIQKNIFIQPTTNKYSNKR